MDKNALTKIFDLYSRSLYQYAFRLSGDAMLADQIVGDVFAKLLEQLSTGKGPTTNLRSYLYETTYHRIVDEVRSARRKAPLEVTDWLSHRSDAVFLRVEDRVLFQQIVHAIRHVLTEDQRHVIVLRFMEELSLRETAAIIGKKVEHVKVIQNRAIVALRKALENKRMQRGPTAARIRRVPDTVGV